MADVKALTGTRVILRAPRLDDAEELFASVASDPEVTRYMSWTPHPDVDETRRVITELFNVGDERNWLIELRDSGEIVGTCGFRRVQAHSVDFGYCLGRRWWGQRTHGGGGPAPARRDGKRPEGVPNLCDMPRRQHPVGARAGTGRPVLRGQAGPAHRLPEHQRRAAGCPAVRQGGQVTTPRTAHARAVSVKPESAPAKRSRNRARSCSRAGSASADA